ncbi:hypothetical protein [Portibacter lacus]|uniref:Uncharacterized protein n=1 Tax=Portibacter lacus TaxID=1099794 RepID=A0AA37SLL0_9BACT|nr:hypothetical protein [Portibacter lacus]GLR15517.1 hypothetical protein GCM10007940_01320 [Portibacter lacus]
MKTAAICLILCLTIFSCEEKQVTITNPPASGFNLEGSDAKAIEIADAVMLASGGRAAWDSTEYLQWRFFGNRLHTWNKKSGDLIIESEKDSLLINMNLESMTGSVKVKGEVVDDVAAQKDFLKRGKEFWINDSYWIFLPYKLKDSGVTLKYIGKGETTSGEEAEKVQLTFEGVGVTPENKYVVYVDPNTNLVSQWDFYTNFEDEEPRFSTPWTDYKTYEGLKLSSSRGDGRGMQDIAVGQELASKFK